MITEWIRRLRAGETSACALTEALLAAIEARGGEINAYLTVCAARARAAAEAADARLAAGNAPALCGIPMALKDNLAAAGVPMTCASRMLEGFVPPYSAAAWERLEAAGAVLLGKTNLDEFAMGAGTENSAFGVTRNPHDPTRVAGGSSGGSAAAVAAGMAGYALGSDTGGSVRVPAAYCGVVGLKPAYGRISRWGLTAFASSLDTVGILAATVRDAALVLAAVCGADARDATSVDAPPPGAPDRTFAGRLGVPAGITDGCAPSVAAAFGEAAARMAACGWRIVEAPWPREAEAYAAYYLLSAAEASSNLARYDGIRYGVPAKDAADVPSLYTDARARFGGEVRRRILAGTYILHRDQADGTAIYARAQAARAAVRATLEAAFADCDVILTPSTPTAAYPVGMHDDEAVAYRGCDRFTVPASLAGVPSVSVPFGHEGRLPLGMCLTAPAMREDVLLAAAASLERCADGL